MDYCGISKNWFYVPKKRLRDVLLKECHDGPLVAMLVQNAP
jgi:hypothetical protein